VALFLALFASLKNYKNITNYLLAIFFSSALLISFSRSFWVAMTMALIFSLVLIIYLYSWRKMLISLTWFILSVIGGFALIYLVAVFPYPNPGKFNADFLNRVSSGSEAALTSRWSLLPVLIKEIGKEPFLGQGYGATITYISSDPRILEKNQSGAYTTYAFEWGYFDIWLKIGLLGLLSYLLIIFQLIKKSIIYGHKYNNFFLLGLSASLVFLAITNFFTPYLNHPLGIGILILGACLIKKDKVY
jgi:O-antigen ligase